MNGDRETSHSPKLPPLLALPEDALGKIVREKVIIEGRTFVLERPDDSHALLDHPMVRSAFAADEYLPYWTDLWPAARMLAKSIARESWPPGLTALEIGCGLGLPGIAALSQGLKVIFTDYDPTALRFASRNARINGHRDFETMQLDWRYPPDDLQVPVVLAADLIYELRSVEPLVQLIQRILQPDGLCLLTDQDRVPGHVLRATLPQCRLSFTTELVRAGEPGGRRFKGTLYRIRHAKS